MNFSILIISTKCTFFHVLEKYRLPEKYIYKLVLLADSFSDDPPEGDRRGALNLKEDINDNQETEQDYLEYLEGVGSRLASPWYV